MPGVYEQRDLSCRVNRSSAGRGCTGKQAARPAPHSDTRSAENQKEKADRDKEIDRWTHEKDPLRRDALSEPARVKDKYKDSVQASARLSEVTRQRRLPSSIIR